MKVSLCKGCIKELEVYYPYVEDTLEVDEVPMKHCDNLEANLGKEHKVPKKAVSETFIYERKRSI